MKKTLLLALSLAASLQGCTLFTETKYVMVDPNYQITTEKTLFGDNKNMFVSALSFSDHPGITNYPDVKVALSSDDNHDRVVMIRIIIAEPIEITHLSFNADGNTYNIASRPSEGNGHARNSGASESGIGQFIISRDLLSQITYSKRVTVQVRTSNGEIEKVLTNGSPTITQDAFKRFLEASKPNADIENATIGPVIDPTKYEYRVK